MNDSRIESAPSPRSSLQENKDQEKFPALSRVVESPALLLTANQASIVPRPAAYVVQPLLPLSPRISHLLTFHIRSSFQPGIILSTFTPPSFLRLYAVVTPRARYESYRLLPAPANRKTRDSYLLVVTVLSLGASEPTPTYQPAEVGNVNHLDSRKEAKYDWDRYVHV